MDDMSDEDERPTLRGNSEKIKVVVEHYKSLNSGDPKQVFAATQELRKILSFGKKKKN